MSATLYTYDTEIIGNNELLSWTRIKTDMNASPAQRQSRIKIVNAVFKMKHVYICWRDQKCNFIDGAKSLSQTNYDMLLLKILRITLSRQHTTGEGERDKKAKNAKSVYLQCRLQTHTLSKSAASPVSKHTRNVHRHECIHRRWYSGFLHIQRDCLSVYRIFHLFETGLTSSRPIFETLP